MTIRATLLKELVSRIDALDDWTAALRGKSNTVASGAHAIVYQDAEDKRFANSNAYQATLRVIVLVTVRVEDADAIIDEGNGYLYLDRRVGEIEAVVHSPDSWGASPLFNDVMVTGHDVMDPERETELMARVFVDFKYRHDYQDPSA
jgi:hypothetical protein